MNTIKGENLMFFVKEDDLFGNGSNAMIALALATTCSLNISVEAFDVTSKDSGSWAASKAGMKSWDGSSDNLVCPHIDALMTLLINRTEFTVYWSPAANTENNNSVTHAMSLTFDGNTYKYYYGKVWINNISVNAANNDAANYTVSFTGTGPLTPSNSLPSEGIGSDRNVMSITQGSAAKVAVTGATGTLTATTSNAKVSATVTNGVVTISVADDATPGPYTVTITDSGTSTTTYVYVTVEAS